MQIDNIYLSIYLSIYSIYLSIYYVRVNLSIYLSIYLSISFYLLSICSLFSSPQRPLSVSFGNLFLWAPAQGLEWGMMCSGNASVPKTTNHCSPCKCQNSGEPLFPPLKFYLAFSFFWSPDQTQFLLPLCEYLSPSLPEKCRKSCALPRISPGPLPFCSPGQTCLQELYHF
ncbi:unnamed protein product [Acanthosepion pharaonis]|uniref:Uncharacterized protein n=1 Tax=Acanthosepion pharaonis TaxID=158019 RepID=A0A812BXZ8_ACAPH|nr:unnamed protein product [Sepia pharaonis]